jgi:hypothetical protein
MLGHMADETRLYERNALKDFLTSILDRIELDPDQQTLQLCYRIPLRGGVSVASPRGPNTNRSLRDAKPDGATALPVP